MFDMFRKRSAIPEMIPEDVQQRLAQGEKLQIVDVREPEEYAEAHVPGSLLIPLGQLAQRMDELPKDTPLVMLCRSGNRSGVAAELLQRAGRNDVTNLRGGIIAWARSGLPLERGR
ncbi:MAG: sulfurtransferase [Herpetosiphonaceae bacterium]|nr:MAG: sulfurtransferase [Herpetosiphonaceae bacterium]